MTSSLIPLSSDTETQPTEGMRDAIARAVVGDEQHGNDPTVNALQERVAELLGKEAALWLPSGTMCNFVATKVHTQPADAIIAERMSHIIRAESAGVALSSGVLIEPIETSRGIFTAEELRQALGRLESVPVPYGQPCGMITVEQTHNLNGGCVWQLKELGDIADVGFKSGVPVHMDGARLLNACETSGVKAADFARTADSLWIDFTKGLGAPIGAVMAGTAAFIAKARRIKHVFGGAMRQAGIAAAGCLYALDHHVERLSEDHDNARILASGLGSFEGIEVINPVPETNMVFFDVSGLGMEAPAFAAAMASKGVKLGVVRGKLRAVTHLDVSAADIQTAIHAAAEIGASPEAQQLNGETALNRGY